MSDSRVADLPSDYSPLAIMNTLGDAYLDYDGNMVDSAEYVAALYESYAADHEYVSAMQERYGSHRTAFPVPPVNSAQASAGDYATTAQNSAEELWTRDIERVQEEEFYRHTMPMGDE